MSIQRWGLNYHGYSSPDGAYVLYADHVAAVEEEGRSWQKAIEETLDERDRAVAAERDRIRQAVEALESGFLLCIERAVVLSIIDGEE